MDKTRAVRVGSVWRWRLVLLAAAACAAFGTGTAPAAAAAEPPPELLWQTPEDEVSGVGAGDLENPRGLAASPITGDVYVAEAENYRVSQFTVWGEFVRAFGWGVRDGSPEPQICTAQTGCREGIEGKGPGQLDEPLGLETDASGAVYVSERGNLRISKFSPEGEFLLMFGGNVNKSTGAEVCTAAEVEAGQECGAGESGTGPGFISYSGVGDTLALGPADTIYLGDTDRIQKFGLDGSFKGEIPFSGDLAPLANNGLWGLAVDAQSGTIYASSFGDKHVHRISATGDPAGIVEQKIQVEGEEKAVPARPLGLAVDSAGALYVVDGRPTAVNVEGPFEVLKFDAAGNCLVCGVRFAEPDTLETFGKRLNGLATSSACGIPGSDLYVSVFRGSPVASYLQAYGPAPQDTASCPPPPRPPAIEDQFATAATADAASVAARINPRFWLDTTYYVQYGGQQCLDSGFSEGCQTAPAAPQTLTDRVSSGGVRTAPVRLSDLEPDTTYHYRFVAQSSGGGPVSGAGGASFHTFPEPLAPRSGCLNQARRSGPGAFLPDCRAYEMVSPIDKEGGDIATLTSIKQYPTALYLSAANGETATYSSSKAFAGALSARWASQYLARRNPQIGWVSEAISPPRQQPIWLPGTVGELDLQFKLFSETLDEAWLMQEADPPLDRCGVPGFVNFYRRDVAGNYEAITTVTPPLPPEYKSVASYLPEVQGVSADGAHTVFRANAPLTSDAATIDGYQLYEHVAGPGCGETHLVSVLPDGGPSQLPNSAGGVGSAGQYEFIESREVSLQNAVSDDGAKIYWTAASDTTGVGRIYLRLNGAETIPVSSAPASFRGAAADGSSAFYIQNGSLFKFSLASRKSTRVASQVSGLAGVSEDASRAYFVSNKALAAGAVEGLPNLYSLLGVKVTLVATLEKGDATDNNAPAAVDKFIPVQRWTRVTADGRYLVFTSSARLTGAANTEVDSGLPTTQVFLFDAEAGDLRCVSCNTTGIRPSGRILGGQNNFVVGVGGQIPAWQNQFHPSRVLSEDGSRVFFESYEPLVLRDTNGEQDVYQWERAEGEADCEALGAELWSPESGGCLSLISSGSGDSDSFFADASADGSDVFFRTAESLVPQDPGSVDLYDAREGGGFAAPDPGCGEECPPPSPPSPPPAPPGAASSRAGDDAAPDRCADLRARARVAAKKARTLRKRAGEATKPSAARKLRRQSSRSAGKARQLRAKVRSCEKGRK